MDGRRGYWSVRLLPAVLLLLPFVFFVVLVGGTHQDQTTFDWYNTSWQHRVGLEIETNTYVEDWPIERRLNMTALLRGQNNTAAFDNQSVRVFEYYDNGTLRRELPSQFDEADAYDKTGNAVGTLVFRLDGGTPTGVNTTYFVYFDSEDHGPKAAPVYTAPDLTYSVGQDTVLVNTSKFNYTIDRLAKDNLTGLVDVFDQSFFTGISILTAEAGERPIEYPEFTNGTHDFTFNLSNVSVQPGPVRTTVRFTGFREFYNVSNDPQDLLLTKRYHFYDRAGENTTAFVTIDQEIENVAGSNVTFRSTGAGALAVDANRTLQSNNPRQQLIVNETDPFSIASVRGVPTSMFAGVMNIRESLGNFLATYYDPPGAPLRTGINMTELMLQPGNETNHTAFLSAGYQDTGEGTTEINNLNTMFRNQPSVVQYPVETVTVTVAGDTNVTVFNRDEPVRLIANLTEDVYNVTRAVNATVSMNTTGTGDDETVVLTRVLEPWDTATDWEGLFQLNNTSRAGSWTVNFTAYTAEETIAGAGTHTFTVSDQYAANLTIKNPVDVAGSVMYANMTVQNIRQDANITGANVSCSFGAGVVDPSNISAFNVSTYPGLYTLNFTSPSTAADYTLSCNATRDGNTGQATDAFRTEVAKVVPNVTFDPASFLVPNVTVVQGLNISFLANVSNEENGTMSSTNISFAAPAAWSLNVSATQCGDIVPDAFCEVENVVTVPNATAPGNYSVNLSTEWINPDGSPNATNTSFSVEVAENPVLNVSETNVSGGVGGGNNLSIGSFDVVSEGNVNLTNVSSACVSGDVCTSFDIYFAPVNISTIGVGANQSVQVTVSVPAGFAPGLYNGTINVSSVSRFDTLAINVSVVDKTTVATDTDPSASMNADNITLQQNQTLGFTVNASNTGGALANNTNVSISIPANWSTNLSQQACGVIDTGAFCERNFFVTVPNATVPGNYGVTATTEWKNPDNTTDSSNHSLTVQVLQNPVQNVPENTINGSVPTAASGVVGNVTVESVGNYNLSTVAFSCGFGAVCENMSVEFTPPNISTIGVGENRSVAVNVSVPARFPAGNYSGTLNISSTGGTENVTVNVEVPITRSWTLSPGQCQTSSDPAIGTACQPLINNTGNAPFNISVQPSSANNTNVTPQTFSVPFGTAKQFNVTYNVTGVENQLHQATYNVSSVQAATPRWRFLNISIFPAVKPNIGLNITPVVLDQGETTRLLANITVGSGFPLDRVIATVTPPENTVKTADMQQIAAYNGTASDTTLWQLFYPNGTGFSAANTSTRGSYTINISANDTIGNAGFNASAINVTAKLTPRLSTISPVYKQGDNGDINYSLLSFFNQPIGGATVNLSVLDPTGAFVGLVEDNPFQTRSTSPKPGFIMTPDDGRPTFTLSDGAVPGVYEVVANASWPDPVTNLTEDVDSRAVFFVNKSGQFTVNWDAGRVWFPGANFTVFAAMSRENDLVTVDSTNLTVYDSSGQVNTSFTGLNVVNQRTGVYRFWKQLPSDLPHGVYTAELEAVVDGSKTVDFQTFRVVSRDVGLANFDVNLSLLEHEVPQDDFVDFNISLTKVQGQPDDAKVTYWVEDQGGTQYSYTSELIFTPLNKTLVVPRNLFIYSDQPTGNYSVTVKVEPLDVKTTFGPVSKTFRVIKKNATPEQETIVREETETRTAPPPEPAPEPAPELETNVSIVDAPRGINLVRGRSAVKPVVIANSGDTRLDNVSLSVVGIPPSWVDIAPNGFNQLGTGTTETFTVTFTPASDASVRSYNATFLVAAATATARRPVQIEVFVSLEEKIAADIDRLETELARLEARIDGLERQGVDVSAAQTVAAEIRAVLDSARNNLDQGRPNTALQDISEADSLLVEGDQIVRKLRAAQERRQFDLLPLLLGALVLLAVVLTAAYFLQVRGVRPVDAVQERVHGLLLDMKRSQIKEAEQLREQKRKTQRLVELLEVQHDEGIISDDSYRELKQSAEEKLKRINSQLRDH